MVQAARLRVDARKWIASKVLPKQYGDRLAVAGDADNPVKVFHQISYVIVDPKEPDDAADFRQQHLDPVALRALSH